MMLYKRMFQALIWMDATVKIYWSILFATYIVAQVVTFTDCHPLDLYWQVVPDPGIRSGNQVQLEGLLTSDVLGTCAEALNQLLILGLITIITDVMLIVLPMPLLFKVQRSVIQ